MPTTPATAGPEWIPGKVEHTCTRLCSLLHNISNILNRKEKIRPSSAKSKTAEEGIKEKGNDKEQEILSGIFSVVEFYL